jgi:5'-3' exonuclease
VSRDRDYCQLHSPWTTQVFGSAPVSVGKQLEGVPPHKHPLYRALVGDASDGISGVCVRLRRALPADRRSGSHAGCACQGLGPVVGKKLVEKCQTLDEVRTALGSMYPGKRVLQ